MARTGSSSAWLAAEDAMSLLSTGTVSKLNQELSRGVDPNQRLEIPQLEKMALPRAALRVTWPPVPAKEHALYSSGRMQDFLIPPRLAAAAAGRRGADVSAAGTAAAAADAAAAEDPAVAEIRRRWAWDPSWHEYVPTLLAGEQDDVEDERGGGSGGGGDRTAGTAPPVVVPVPPPSDSQWPLLLVACSVGRSSALVERLLKAGADPNAVHPPTGLTALMCLVANDEMGLAAKREVMQALHKHGFRRWGAVRRDSCQDAVLMALCDVAGFNQAWRRALAPVAAAGGGGGGDAVQNARKMAAGMAAYQKQLNDGMALVEELVRRRCWPPARGAPHYLAPVLTKQLALSLLLADSAATRMLEVLAGPGAGGGGGGDGGGGGGGGGAAATGLGPNTTSMGNVAAMALSLASSGLDVTDASGRMVLQSPAQLLRRVRAAGLRSDVPLLADPDMRTFLEPALYMHPDYMAAALRGGLHPDTPPGLTLGVARAPPWGSLLAEAVAEGYPIEFVHLLLQHGADPRLPVLGCVRPLLLALLAGNEPAMRALLHAGADPDTDGPPGDSPPAPASREELTARLRELRGAALAGQAAAGAGVAGSAGAEAGEVRRSPLAPHLGWLRHIDPLEACNLVPFLAGPCRASAHLFLALLHSVTAAAPRKGMDIPVPAPLPPTPPPPPKPSGGANGNGGSNPERGARPAWRTEPLPMVDLGSAAYGLLADFMRQVPACPYLPYVMELLPCFMEQVMLSPQLTELLPASIQALADHLDPPTPTPSDASSSASASSASHVPVPASAPRWPPPAELPGEVLGSMLRLPRGLGLVMRNMSRGQAAERMRKLCDSSYAHSALRLASALLREHARTDLQPSQPPQPAPQPSANGSSQKAVAAAAKGKAVASQSDKAAAASAAAADGDDDSPETTGRWRLLATVFCVTLPGLGRGLGSAAGLLPPLTWLPTAVLLLYDDPWVRALVASPAIDAMATATHEAAASAAAAAEPPSADGAAAAANGDDSGAKPWEERLAAALEGAVQDAIREMSYGYSCHLSAAVRDVWVCAQAAAAHDARVAAAAAAAAPPPSNSSSSSSSSGRKAAAKKPSSTTAASSSPPASLSYPPYGRCLVAVPRWVQLVASRWVQEVLMACHEAMRAGGGGLPMARALLAARQRLGPPRG